MSIHAGADLSKSDCELLRTIHKKLGSRKAKELIRDAWESGIYDPRLLVTPNADSDLQRLRNGLGPSWLHRLSLKNV